jgi:ribosomal protein S18 acetylase RimI-like enzyme
MWNKVEDLHLSVYRQPSLGLAQKAVHIGSDAWRERFKHRRDELLARMYDPADPGPMLEQMRRRAALGNFVCVVADAQDDEYRGSIGVVWGSNDASGNRLQRFGKRLAGHRPYAVMSHLNVLPAYQRSGVGTVLVDAFLREFRPDQKPTVYVFDENQPALTWYRDRLGYQPSPARPRMTHDYFGTEEVPVRQWRLEALSAAAVRETIAQHAAELPQPTTVTLAA